MRLCHHCGKEAAPITELSGEWRCMCYDLPLCAACYWLDKYEPTHLKLTADQIEQRDLLFKMHSFTERMEKHDDTN